MATHEVMGGGPRTAGCPWLRAAGWLVLLPPLFFVRQIVLVLDRFPKLDRAWRVVEFSFGFWRRGAPIEYRLQAVAGLLLFLAACIVGLIAAFGGIGRIATVLLAAAQALVCPLGIVWSYDVTSGRLPPESIRKLPVPVPGGRATCVLYLLLAIGAVVLALAKRRPAGRSLREREPPIAGGAQLGHQ